MNTFTVAQFSFACIYPSASNIPVSPAFDFLAGAGTAVGGIWDIIKSDSASEPDS